MPARILIVDDEKDMLVLLRRMITEERDYEVISDPDPARALERFRKDPVELVITDLKMPAWTASRCWRPSKSFSRRRP